MEKVLEFIKKCGVYYIATVDEGKARVRPFGTINIFDGKLYIQTGKSKPCFAQMIAAPVELCCFDGEKWLRLSGTLVNDDRIEAKKDMLDNYPDLRNMYDENDDNTAVLYFKDAKAEFSSFTAAPEVVEF